MENIEEVWKDVIGYEDYFKVSNIGNIFSKRTNKILKLVISKTGYHIFSTKLNGRNSKAICFKVHRLVAEAFLDEPEKYIKDWASNTFYRKVYVNHKDGNKLNNIYTNLEWVTNSENIKHALENNLLIPVKGSNSLLCRLDNEQVRYIRQHFKPRDREFGSRALGRKFNVGHTTIMKIIKYETYSDI